MPLKKYLDYDGLDYLIQRIPRTKIRVTFDDVFAGETATCSMGTTTYTKTVPATEPYELVFPVNELGTWTIATSYLGDDYGTTVEVTAIGQTATGHVSYVTEIDGATVTPTDDITTWLKCANIEDSSITTLADVLANRSLFETLIANSNACKYMARSTSWAGDPSGIVSIMSSDVGPELTVSYSSLLSNQYAGWKVFDGTNTNATDSWHSVAGSASTEHWIQFDFNEPRNIRKLWVKDYNNNFSGTTEYSVQCYVNDEWITLKSLSYTLSQNAEHTIDLSSNNYTSTKYRLIGKGVNSSGNYYLIFGQIQLYEGITSNQDAMSLIGKYDYCSNALLGNATWAEAIANSNYWGSILQPLVPKMTSNTTPSGTCYMQNVQSNNPAYKAFDRDNSTGTNDLGTVNPPLELTYEFSSKRCINKIRLRSRRIATGKIQGLNDNNVWVDLVSITGTNDVTDKYYNVSNNSANYKKYRVYELTSTTSASNTARMWVDEVQFYGRASAQTNIIHSAPNDTIYMIDNGTQVPLCTTNSDGDGILDFSQFIDGTYTLYSSVAKDPMNLSNDYSKSVRITKTSYGCTTEAYLMPDTVKTLYWHGYESDNAEDCISANGWSGDGNYGLNAPTHGTNSIQLYSTGSSTTALSAFGSKTKVKTSKIHGIGNVTTTTGNTKGLMLRNDKSLAVTPIVSFINSTSDQHIHFDVEPSGEYYFLAMARLSTTVTLKALWYE